MILFDLGGVLVENATFDQLDLLIPEPMDRHDLRERWLHSPSVQEFELGRIAPGEFADRFVAEWGVDMGPAEFLDAFASWPQGPYAGAESLVGRCREDHHVSCLSNCNEIHWEGFQTFLSWFDTAYSSHIIGAVKPDATAFEAVLGQTPPGDVWFFDDSSTNVEAARAVGMRSYRVDGIVETERVLAREGLLRPQAQDVAANRSQE